MHAILIESTYDDSFRFLPKEIHTPTPDIVHFRGARMGIDDVRSLTREAYLTPLSGDRRVFVLAYDVYIHESQNALLKLLEEPPKTAYFYVIIERADALLPTLYSRLLVHDTGVTHINTSLLDTFQRLSYAERLTEIGNRVLKKDEGWLISLMEAFVVYAHKSHNRDFMKSLIELAPLFRSQGSSKKMIFEHLALLLPKI